LAKILAAEVYKNRLKKSDIGFSWKPNEKWFLIPWYFNRYSVIYLLISATFRFLIIELKVLYTEVSNLTKNTVSRIYDYAEIKWAKMKVKCSSPR
jgi:hypothetical protein